MASEQSTPIAASPDLAASSVESDASNDSDASGALKTRHNPRRKAAMPKPTPAAAPGGAGARTKLVRGRRDRRRAGKAAPVETPAAEESEDDDGAHLSFDSTLCV